jgi:protein gp37
MNKSKDRMDGLHLEPSHRMPSRLPILLRRKQARRFSGDVRLNKGSEQLKRDENGLYILEEPFKNQVTGKVIPDPVGFEPIMHRYRMPHPAQKKKSAKIFVCSMADLFGAWVPDSWIEEVFKACDAAPWHTYMFLTKNPKRYCDLANTGKLPKKKNFWYGTTLTTAKDLRFPGGRGGYNTFLSIEPILEFFDAGIGSFGDDKWIIIGAETGKRKGKVIAERKWVENIVETAGLTHAAVFMKDSLEEIWGESLIQEWPEGMPADKGNDVPHCKECEHHKTTQEGKRGERHECEKGHRHITGRHVRTSPPWCPKRREEAQK